MLLCLLLLAACKVKRRQAPVAETITGISAKLTSVSYQASPLRISTDKENYASAYVELKAMLEAAQPADFERAVFLSENPYHSNGYTYREYQQVLNYHQHMISAIAGANYNKDTMDFNVQTNERGRFRVADLRFAPQRRKELYEKALSNWAIFTYITDTTSVFPHGLHLPFTYTSGDPFGLKDWTSSQVLHLLTGKAEGNCYTLAAFFKIMADRLGSEARICTAPQHIYIQHQDVRGVYYNVELATAGHPGDGTIKTLTQTTTEGLRSGIALRSYNQRQSIGLCVINLAKSYEHRFETRTDDFILQCAELVLQHDSLNLSALLLKQQVLDTRVKEYATAKKLYRMEALKRDERIVPVVTALETHLSVLYRLGYRQMPAEVQEVVLNGFQPLDREEFSDKNPQPYSTTKPQGKDARYQTLFGGLFQEFFSPQETETYGHFRFSGSSGKITFFDTSGSQNPLIDPVAFAYDFGARMYDPRVGRFLSIDPLAGKYPGLSPYAAFNNNPVYYIDPTGESGVAYETGLKNKNGKPILKVVTKLHIYGEGATEVNRKVMETNANAQYNNDGQFFTAKVGSTEYEIQFEISVVIIDAKEVDRVFNEGGGVNNAENNFYEIRADVMVSFTFTGEESSSGGNTGVIKTSDVGTPTIEHELNHGYGGVNKDNDHYIKSEENDIAVQGKNSKDLLNRKVTQENIQEILKNVTLIGGKGDVGNPRPQLYDKDSEREFRPVKTD
jgi:RHS repeat-associated protein